MHLRERTNEVFIILLACKELPANEKWSNDIPTAPHPLNN